MSHPETRPAEMQRLQTLAQNDPYRMEVIMLLSSVRESSRRLESELKDLKEWTIQHDRDDALKFQSIEARLKSAAADASDYDENKQQLIGAKKLIVGIVAILGAVGGTVLAVIEFIRFVKERHP